MLNCVIVQSANDSLPSTDMLQTSIDKSQDGSSVTCQCVMAKALSLNEVSSHNLDPDTTAHISLDAESGPSANRRRRKRYSESRNSAQKVSVTPQ